MKFLLAFLLLVSIFLISCTSKVTYSNLNRGRYLASVIENEQKIVIFAGRKEALVEINYRPGYFRQSQGKEKWKCPGHLVSNKVVALYRSCGVVSTRSCQKNFYWFFTGGKGRLKSNPRYVKKDYIFNCEKILAVDHEAEVILVELEREVPSELMEEIQVRGRGLSSPEARD